MSDRPLVPVEQFALGGINSIRGYRQDALLTDNGFSASAEWRFPLLKLPEAQTTLYLSPFIDFGTGWNSGNVKNPDTSTLTSVGLALQLLLGDRVSVRLDWGIPLTPLSSTQRTWQENGLHFSIQVSPF